MEFEISSILRSTTTAMTNNEILQANYLDILFEHRNKAYGAYALRNGYNHRLWLGVSVAVSTILLLILVNALGGARAGAMLRRKDDKEGYILRTYQFEKRAEQPTVPNHTRQAALVHNSGQIKIVSDIPLKMEMPVHTGWDGNEFPEQSVGAGDDQPSGGQVLPAGKAEVKSQPVDFLPVEQPAEFPGGLGALIRYFYRYLKTPGDLASGESKRVIVRFNVDSSGLISAIEVVNSGGTDCDAEVIRVCKKMPRWKAAIQNGIKVTVSYVLPVTFVGGEQ